MKKIYEEECILLISGHVCILDWEEKEDEEALLMGRSLTRVLE